MSSKAFPWAVLIALVLGLPGLGRGEWSDVGSFAPPKRVGAGVVFLGEQGTLSVSAVTPFVVRVRFAPRSPLGRDHSYSVLQHPEAPSVELQQQEGISVLGTSELRVVIRHNPLRIAFEDKVGLTLNEDDPGRGTAFSGSAVRVWQRLPADAKVYGLGEKAGHLEVRGPNLEGVSYTMWNTDAYGWQRGTDPLYASVPFFLVLRKGIAYGIFLDNTYRSFFDVGHETPDLLSFGASGGELNYYFISGPSPKEVLERYTSLTGRSPLPPLWALGYHQCRYSYYPESRVRFIADNFRARKIPADTLWLDIHYLDSFKPFTWDRTRFPDPGALLKDLRREGFHLVTIVDPHPKKETGYAPYDSGLQGNHFVRRPDGSVYEGPVWPSRAERNPQPSVFPDFSRPATRDWWGELYRSLVELGVSGIWNDMDEPAVFDPPLQTIPLDVRHDNEGQPTTHAEIHNVYGMLLTRSTYEGLLKFRPTNRPFVLTRATFAGGQRYAAIWTGDNSSDWGQLRLTIPMIASLGLSGFPFAGADIGGFTHGASSELFTRWLQLGAFTPFMRAHTELGNPDQEPWSYGERFEQANRSAIELRYRLLPYIYAALEEASRTGLPPFRPLFLEYPTDAAALTREDEFFFGPSLLVAPVLYEGAVERRIYLPEGDWYDFWTGEPRAGGQEITVKVGLDSIPIFVRGGGILPEGPVLQHTGERAGKPLIISVYPSARSATELYDDDGESFAYREGAFLRRRLLQERTPAACTLRLGETEGTFRPPPRDLVIHLHGCGQATRVTAMNEALPRVSDFALDSGQVGWTARGEDLIVRIKERWDIFTVVAQKGPLPGKVDPR